MSAILRLIAHLFKGVPIVGKIIVALSVGFVFTLPVMIVVGLILDIAFGIGDNVQVIILWSVYLVSSLLAFIFYNKVEIVVKKLLKHKKLG
jgi:hypothetical protein